MRRMKMKDTFAFTYTCNIYTKKKSDLEAFVNNQAENTI